MVRTCVSILILAGVRPHGTFFWLGQSPKPKTEFKVIVLFIFFTLIDGTFFFLFQVYRDISWHTVLCKFKVYGIMIWLKYIRKQLPQCLVNIHHFIKIQNKRKRKKFFLVMKFPLNLHVYNSVNYIYHIIDNILVLIYLVTRHLYLLSSSNFLSYHPSY